MREDLKMTLSSPAKTQQNTLGQNINESNLIVRKMTVSYNVVGAIEKTLSKILVIYRYNEVITKTFLATTGQQSWKHDDIFAKEPIRRFIFALCVGIASIGTNTANLFLYQKFGLREITIYRNGFATAETTISTTDNKKLYYNSMSALAYLENGHGIPLSEFANNYIMAFDLTSTRGATHYFIHPELTNSSLSVELKFDAVLAHNVEFFFLGKELLRSTLTRQETHLKTLFPWSHTCGRRPISSSSEKV